LQSIEPNEQACTISLTRDLVRLIRAKPICQDDLRRAYRFVLDTLACALGALKTEPARIFAKVSPPRGAGAGQRAFYFRGPGMAPD